MRQFTHVVADAMGIHARPAGMLAKYGYEFADTAITITAGGKTVNVLQLVDVMGLGVLCGDEILVAAEGESEAEAIETLRRYCQESL